MSSVQKKSRLNYNGKKKYFTQKFQIIEVFKTGRILSSNFYDGKMHDFRLFQKSESAVQPLFLFLLIQHIRESQKITKTAELHLKMYLSFERIGKEGEQRTLKTADNGLTYI